MLTLYKDQEKITEVRETHHVPVRSPIDITAGLKAQHVSCLKWLAKATSAETEGCFVGSKTIEFKPTLSPADIKERDIKIDADSPASILLVLQAILPILLFASDANTTPVNLSIKGGSNAAYSLSYEYLDQVLLPSLERFGIKVERHLKRRGWSQGPLKLGCAEFKIYPMPLGQSFKAPDWPAERGTLTRIDVSILVQDKLQKPVKVAMLAELARVFPGVPVNFVLEEDSIGIYTILVAHTSTGLRFGRDWLYDRKTKGRSPEEISEELVKRVVKGLDRELNRGGVVDEHLQDQLVIFQALADGRSVISGCGPAGEMRNRLDRTGEPFGDGTKHTTTARWVTSELLPNVRWYDGGQVCEGVGWKAGGVNSASIPAAQDS
jgi:RNA 3'-terminal phosphate cyclase (ATP)